MENKYELVLNPLEDDPVVTDIIVEYNNVLNKLVKVEHVIQEYQDTEGDNQQLETGFRELYGEQSAENNPDILKDNEDLDF